MPWGDELQIDSVLRQGTTSTLTIPLEIGSIRLERTTPTYPSKKEGKPTAVGPSVGVVSRVLIVDDHAVVRQGLRSLLEGYDDLEVSVKRRMAWKRST